MRIDFRTGQRKSLTLADLPIGEQGLTYRDEKSLAMTKPVDPKVDTGRMTATATINTDAVDYEGEVILASGVSIANYVQNPVVMWDHGKSLTTLPIGSSASPDGELDLARSDFEIEATTYFSQSFPLARQIFGLIDEGVIRATSIHVVPSAVAAYRMEDGTEVMVTEESDLIEYSWCPFGVNPEAVRRMKSLSKCPERFREAFELQMDHAARVLDRGSLGGDKLLPSIRKSLTAMVPKTGKLLVNPFDSSTDATDMKNHLTNRELRKLSKRQLKSLSIEDYDEDSQERIKSLIADEEVIDDAEKSGLLEDEELKSGDELDDSIERSELDAETVPELDDESLTKSGDELTPLGQKVLREAYEAVKYVVEYLREALGPVENETVKSGLNGELQTLSDSVDTIRGLFAAAYPDSPGFDDEGEQTKSLEVEEQLKSMLAASDSNRYRTLGIKSMVARLASDTSIPANKRKSLRAVDEKLGRLIESSGSFQPKGYVPKAEFDRLSSQFDKLVEKVESLVLPASEA